MARIDSRNCPISTKLKQSDYLKVKVLAQKLNLNQTELVRSAILLFLEQNSNLLQDLSLQAKPPSLQFQQS